MHTHQELEAILYAHKQVLSIVDFNVKLSLQSVMHMNAGLDADLVILTVPVGFVSDWHAVPAVWIHSSQLCADASNDTLREHVRLIHKTVISQLAIMVLTSYCRW